MTEPGAGHKSFNTQDCMDDGPHMSVPWFQGLGVKEISLVINRVMVEEVTSPNGKKADKTVVRFEGIPKERDKGLALSTKNHRRIAGLAGSYESDKWIGLKVTIHLETDKLYGGGKGPTLKIKVA